MVFLWFSYGFSYVKLPEGRGEDHEKGPERVGRGRNRKCAEAFVKAKGAKGDVGDFLIIWRNGRLGESTFFRKSLIRFFCWIIEGV